jgi:hypothetical protein
MKPVQYFSDEYLAQCRAMTPEQIIGFLDDFRQLHGSTIPGKSKLISIKVPENLLHVFRQLAAREGTPYQTKIKVLMKEWIVDSANEKSS